MGRRDTHCIKTPGSPTLTVMRTAILWFRRDLRLADNPALLAAVAGCERLIPLYIHTPDEEQGGAGRWWLHHSLVALDRALRERGSALVIRSGDTPAALRDLVAETGAHTLRYNRRYEPAAVARDERIEQMLRQNGVQTEGHSAVLLNEPWRRLKADGTPYRVFTPYWNAVRRHGFDAPPGPAPAALPPLPAGVRSLALDQLGLAPRIRWDGGLAAQWTPGEAGAQVRLERFIEGPLIAYLADRERPDREGTSRLSPHLHFGEISPQRIVAAIEQAAASRRDEGIGRNAEGYIRQMVWRDFAHQLLLHFPHTEDRPLDARFERFPWAHDYAENLIAWQFGDTGIPIIDAGMRELWHSGWMHNRVRMIAASFLTKNLLIPWQEGARWFADTLVDADRANNTLGWQWVAGCGADAAPYFRIFNPVSQGEKFDPHGDYVRHWVPELAALPPKWLHQPWNAPQPPADYPPPLVDLRATRQRALDAYAAIKR